MMTKPMTKPEKTRMATISMKNLSLGNKLRISRPGEDTELDTQYTHRPPLPSEPVLYCGYRQQQNCGFQVVMQIKGDGC